MYYFGYLMLLAAVIGSTATAGLGILHLWNEDKEVSQLTEKGHLVTTASYLLACAALLHGLFWQDYSLQYVANYTDSYLSLFYRLTAFWAGQPGSLLFWAACTSVFGTLFFVSKRYKDLSNNTRAWFWIFFHLILCFFGLLLAVYSNPFIMQSPAPADGNGLNPLLQNPGMIIHPPLLFIGYAGFIIPACLSLAQAMSGARSSESPWFTVTRPFLLYAWMFLTAGIILGAWWAYMELGWGGYWAWDPVENSSLIPWLFGTALLHTIPLERRAATHSRFNTALVSITAVSTFFATYLVRSGVVDSVHAFGQSSVGTPLLTGILFFTLLSLIVSLHQEKHEGRLADLLSREGFLALMMWIFLALALIIFTATLWPVFSKLLGQVSQGLDASFYNSVCMPLAVLLLLLLVFCPWLGHTTEKTNIPIYIVAAIFFISALFLWFFGYRKLLPLLAMSSGIAISCVSIFRLVRDGFLNGLAGMYGAHLGVALAALGIAFSTPYGTEKDLLLGAGEREKVDGYVLELKDIAQQDGPGYSALLATLSVERDGRKLGTLVPERRIYEKFGEMQFSEVDTIPSLGNELYVSLLGLNAGKKVLIRFSIKPLVNWLWIGAALMSLMPLLGIRRLTRKEADNNAQTEGVKNDRTA